MYTIQCSLVQYYVPSSVITENWVVSFGEFVGLCSVLKGGIGLLGVSCVTVFREKKKELSHSVIDL